MNATEQTDQKQAFVYPAKIQGLLDPIFYTITNEEVEEENVFFIEKDGFKIPLLEAVNQMLATSRLAKEYVEMVKRNKQMRLCQKMYFKNTSKSNLQNAKIAEGSNDNFLEVCKPTYQFIEKFNQE